MHQASVAVCPTSLRRYWRSKVSKSAPLGNDDADLTGEYDPRPLDVWSCAIVFITLHFGGQPWMEANASHDKAYARFAAAWDKFFLAQPNGLISTGPDGVAAPSGCGPVFTRLPKPALKLLLLKMLHPDPARRARIQDVLNDRWIRTIEVCSPSPEDALPPHARTDSLDVTKKGAKVDRILVRKCHNHLPPKQSKLPQYGFDMGDGYR